MVQADDVRVLVKGVQADGCEGRRQDERLEAGAVLEGGAFDGLQPLEEAEGNDASALGKGGVTD